MWNISIAIFLLWKSCLIFFQSKLRCKAIPKKHHTTPAEIIASDSEDLSPERTLQSRKLKEVQLFLLKNYCARKRILDFQLFTANPPFWNFQKFLFDGTDGNQKYPSMFFILWGNLEHIYIGIYIYIYT